MDISIKIAIIDKNSERVVDDGKRERRQLPLISPLPIVPRALSFSSPQFPYDTEASEKQMAIVQKSRKYCFVK